jgi:hypothetical protein
MVNPSNSGLPSCASDKQSYFGETLKLIRETASVLENTSNPKESYSDQQNPASAQLNSNPVSQLVLPNILNPINDQTYRKVVDENISVKQVSHVSRARDRNNRRSHSFSPYSRNFSGRNRISPVSINRNRERCDSRDKNITRERSREVKS